MMKPTVSLRARILTLVGGFVVMALAIMLFGLASLSDYGRMMADYSRAYENAYMGERLNHTITAIIMEQRGLYLSKTPEEDQRSIKNIEHQIQNLEDVITTWQAEKVATPEIHLDSLAPRIEAFRLFRYEVLRVTLTRSKTEGEQFGLTRRPERLALQADIERVVEQTRQTLAATKARAETYRQHRLISFVLATLAWIAITTGLILWVIAHFITTEITRIRAEEDRREKLLTQLMDTNTELEHFAYAASHDMQEPIRMVNVYSELIASDYGEKLDDTGREYLGMITGSARRMLGLVHDLGQYSGLRHDQVRHVTIDLNTQLDHIRAQFADQIRDTAAQIHVAPLPVVTGNSIQIERLFGHLIANAIRYQPPDQTPVITISATDLGSVFRFDVRDNGLGIPPEFAARIFEPFRRLHTWDQYEGSGMGLAICRKIVERHGGRIWAEATDTGAHLCFTLAKSPATGSGRQPQSHTA